MFHMSNSYSTEMASEIETNLVDAAERILGRDGLEGLTLSAIAEEAQVSRVTLHRRGNRLDDYVVAALRRVSEDLRASLWPAMTGSGPASERLHDALVTLCEVCERHAGVMAAVFGSPVRQVPGQPGRTTSIEFIEPFERLLRDGNVDGSLTSDDPLPDATLLGNAVAWTYLHMRRGHAWDPATAAGRVVSLCTAQFRRTDTGGD
jgi:AcrR family transcriptional regulator